MLWYLNLTLLTLNNLKPHHLILPTNTVEMEEVHLLVLTLTCLLPLNSLLLEPTTENHSEILKEKLSLKLTIEEIMFLKEEIKPISTTLEWLSLLLIYIIKEHLIWYLNKMIKECWKQTTFLEIKYIWLNAELINN